jgi:hypothetical protein
LEILPMPASWQPLRPGAYLRLFAISLALVVICLVGFLFLVDLEAVVPATGTVTARGLHEYRAVFAGLVEVGWYEGSATLTDGTHLAVRLDAHGDGLTDSSNGPSRSVTQYQLLDGDKRVSVVRDSVRFHKLRPGDDLWPGQIVASMRTNELRFKLGQAEERLRHAESPGTGSLELDQARSERDWLRYQIQNAGWYVPREDDLWQVVDVKALTGQAVQPGDVVARIVPLDPNSREPRDLIVTLDLEEDDSGDIAPGQTVTLYSAMHNHRVYGCAEATVERLEPMGDGPEGKRHFHAVARITRSPFSMSLGSSCKAEVVVGKKRVYRIILEH